MRCHQGKHCPTALLKLCSMIPYFCILNTLISAQSFFLSSVSHITVFLPSFLSSSSQSLCEGSSDLGVSGRRRGDLAGRVFASGHPREHQKRNRVPHPDLSSFQLLLGDSFSALSPSLPSQCCSWLLCQAHFSAT